MLAEGRRLQAAEREDVERTKRVLEQRDDQEMKRWAR
jgi:hypothetical protein